MTEPTTAKPKTTGDSPKDGFVKLAMRNMVRQGGTSIKHFSLTIFGVIGSLVLLAVVFH